MSCLNFKLIGKNDRFQSVLPNRKKSFGFGNQQPVYRCEVLDSIRPLLSCNKRNKTEHQNAERLHDFTSPMAQ